MKEGDGLLKMYVYSKKYCKNEDFLGKNSNFVSELSKWRTLRTLMRCSASTIP